LSKAGFLPRAYKGLASTARHFLFKERTIFFLSNRDGAPNISQLTLIAGTKQAGSGAARCIPHCR
jgi:hypothetical protein